VSSPSCPLCPPISILIDTQRRIIAPKISKQASIYRILKARPPTQQRNSPSTRRPHLLPHLRSWKGKSRIICNIKDAEPQCNIARKGENKKRVRSAAACIYTLSFHNRNDTGKYVYHQSPQSLFPGIRHYLPREGSNRLVGAGHVISSVSREPIKRSRNGRRVYANWKTTTP
jgi:hypothetical protein